MKHRSLFAALKSLAIFFLIYIMLSFTVVMLIYEGLFVRSEEYEYSVFISDKHLAQNYKTEEVTFESRGFILNGILFGDKEDKLVILGHGKGGSLRDMLPEAEYFLENNFSVLAFDFTGHNKSGGNSQYGLQQSVYDMENAVNYAKNLGYKDIYLYGIGIGGYAAAACADCDGVRGVAAISAFSSVSDMTLEYATENMSVLGYLEYPIMMLYQFMTYGSDVNESAVKGINSSDVPVVVIHGTADEEVNFDSAALINAADRITNPDVSYVTVEGGLHLSLMRSDAAIDAINSFNEKAYEIYNQYSGEVPVAEIEAVYASVDTEVTSELDDDIMNKVMEVFNAG